MADALQPATKRNDWTEKGHVPVPWSELSPAQQDWVDYNVVQGVAVEADGSMTKVTVHDFAAAHGVDRTTCYRWQKNIPNFWDLVNERRKVIFTGARTAKVWNAVFLSATVKLNPRSMEIYLANADKDFRMPSQPVRHELGQGLADLVAAHRQRVQAENVQVIDVDPSHA